MPIFRKVNIRQLLVDQAHKNAPWLWEIRTENRGRNIALLAGVWSLFFGFSIPAALLNFGGRTDRDCGEISAATATAWIAQALIAMTALVVCAVALVPRDALRRVFSFRKGERYSLLIRERDSAGIYFTGSVLASVISGVLGQWFPTGSAFACENPTGLRRFFYGIAGITAGPEEEILMCLAGLTVLRFAGLSWRWTLTILVAARWSFHVYYGVPSIGFIVWAASLLVGFIVTGRILASVVMHSLWDLSLTVEGSATLYPFILLMILVLVVMLGGIRQARASPAS